MSAQPSRVLVVHDESAIRDTLGDALELEGYECRLAANGEAALNPVVVLTPVGGGVPDRTL